MRDIWMKRWESHRVSNCASMRTQDYLEKQSFCRVEAILMV